jgi:molybdenum cofactor cytidylyltransferase
MGSCKQLLPLEGKTALARSLEALLQGGITDVAVVVRSDAGAVADAAARYRVTVAVASEPDGDMAASIRAGRRAVSCSATGVLIHPCDHPLVSPETVRLLAALHGEDPEALLIPVHAGKKGHPTLFPRKLLDRLESPLTLRDLVREEWHLVRPVEVPDHGTVLDMDTPADYRALAELCRLR